MNGAVMTLARWHARQAIKRELYAKGIKLALLKAVRSPSLRIDTSTIIPRSSAFATEQYQDFVKRGLLKPERKRRKASQ